MMHTDDDAGTQTGSPARPSVGYPIVIDKQGNIACPCIFYRAIVSILLSQLAVEDCLCPKRHLCCVRLPVSYPLDITTT